MRHDSPGKRRRLHTLRGEVIVQREIEYASRRETAIVHLNFVRLCKGRSRRGCNGHHDGYRKPTHAAPHHRPS